MYYEEQIINGVLHYRTIPHGDFKPMGTEQLTHKILEVRELYKELLNKQNLVLPTVSLQEAGSDNTWQEDYWSSKPPVFTGVIFRHKTMGIDEPAIRTIWGNYALMNECHDWARENYGKAVNVKPRKEFYMTVEIEGLTTPSPKL